MPVGEALATEAGAALAVEPVDVPVQESIFEGEETHAVEHGIEQEVEQAPVAESPLRAEPETAVAETSGRPGAPPSARQPPRHADGPEASLAAPRRDEAATTMVAEMPSREAPPPTPAADPDPEPVAASAAVPQQAELDGVQPEARSHGAVSEEDLLDIPAFLRRQAN